ncbi:unnamed protein product, partial [Gulo gulo]
PGTGQAGGGEAGLSEPRPSAKSQEPRSQNHSLKLTHREMSARRPAPSALSSEPMVSCSLKFRKWLLDLRLYEDILFPSFGLTEAQLCPHANTRMDRTASAHPPSEVLCRTSTTGAAGRTHLHRRPDP